MKYLIPFLILIVLVGCSDKWYIRSPLTNEPPIILHPIKDIHLTFVPKTAVIEWEEVDLQEIGVPKEEIEKMRRLYDITPDGRLMGDEIKVELNSYLVSEYYMQEIMKVKVE